MAEYVKIFKTIDDSYIYYIDDPEYRLVVDSKPNPPVFDTVNFHMYIISDEEDISDNDYCIDIVTNKIFTCRTVKYLPIRMNQVTILVQDWRGGHHFRAHCRKVIRTTDEDLGLPIIEKDQMKKLIKLFKTE